MSRGKSDCSVRYEPGGAPLEVAVASTVKVLFGCSIEAAARRTAAEFGVSTGSLAIDDDGALEFVVAARVEAALRRSGAARSAPSTDRAAPGADRPAPSAASRAEGATAADAAGVQPRPRGTRTRLYVPGDQPDVLPNIGLFGADGLILDLEDSVAPPRKLEARILLKRALESHPEFFAPGLVAVRINPIRDGSGLDDLAELAACLPGTVVLPKCESAADVVGLAVELDKLEAAAGRRPGSTAIVPLVETAKGVLSAQSIAAASPRVAALSFGAEDFARDIGAERTASGVESLAARQAIILAAKAIGIPALDSVFSSVDDDQGLAAYCKASKALGFDGVGLIHPRQVRAAKAALAPTPAELETARRIVAALGEAEARGLGTASVDGKMVDAPVAARARAFIDEYGDSEYGDTARGHAVRDEAVRDDAERAAAEDKRGAAVEGARR